ncbi:EF-hand domain-containing protein [Defluviimonas sp. WL0002]|uniref:EF-hand domain-containing protein n=1 Tax=Albidovulum marisflavi TaxID=2984159 RepID=A0ABT2ZBW7_9RHOB|nr:EF-hand domain-containing protein [Defluviimonas sp. WL0002]MCV2868596.1 EF-hand domain-containing protein [Defluviimonas sp. WL0002]
MKLSQLVLSGVFVLAAAASAHAQSAVSDTDGNGTYSMEEMTAAYPDMTAALFSQIDVDGSGEIDADELQAALENGLVG